MLPTEVWGLAEDLPNDIAPAIGVVVQHSLNL